MYRILSVDDDTALQAMLKFVLESAGYEFLACQDGGSALPTALGEKPDLILLDVGLPDMSGIEVCRALKAEPETRHIPVLLITGQEVAVESRVKGLYTGADDYILKPMDPVVLIARIGAILKQVTKPAKF